MEWDLVILGGGAAAFSAAIAASELGARALMLNKGLPIGGTCVNVGCMPSKFLLHAVREYYSRLNTPPWLREAGKVELNFARLIEEKAQLVQALRKRNYSDVLRHLPGIRFVEGRGRLVGISAGKGCCGLPSSFTVEVEGERVQAAHVLIATGARTAIPPVAGIDQAEPLTHIQALELQEPPKSLAIFGAGPLGLEFAQIFRRAGSEVTVIEIAPRILPNHDGEIAAVLQSHLESEGIRFLLGSKVERITGKPGELTLWVNGKPALQAERVLVATGIRPNVEGLGLEELGVARDARGFLRVDARQETNIPGLYAAGDVTGIMPLETVAARQGYNAAYNALTGDARTIDYHRVPHAVFTDPEVAAVGWTEEAARAQLGDCLCLRLSLEAVPRAHAVGDARGMVKLVLHPDDKRLLGAHVVAPHASELIHVPVIAMAAGMRATELLESIFVFPTYGEAWKIALELVERPLTQRSCCVR